MLGWLTLLGTLYAVEPAERLAPGPAARDRSLHELKERLDRAEALETAVTRLQNAWGERLAAGSAIDPCTDAGAASLLARLVVFGPAWRDAAQASRAERDRLVELSEAPTVSGLQDPAIRTAVQHALTRTNAQETHYREAIAWQEAWARMPKGCPLPTAAAAGLAGPELEPPGAAPWIAVQITGGGIACPSGDPADGRVLLVRGGVCLQAEAPCACEPLPVLPAAVLKP